MSAIDISTPKTILNTGILQLQNGVAMDATLRNVADQNNTISPLKLSTASVQVTSTLQITTNDNPYIDAEDGAGNNRFTIGRASTSQQVNVDFASNPTSATDAVGAFRTYANGVALSEAMTFLRNGNVGVGTTAPTSSLTFGASKFITFTNGSFNGYVGEFALNNILNIGTSSGFPIAFRPDNVERMRIASGGNVGIGTTTPSQPLQVNGNIQGTNLISTSNVACGNVLYNNNFYCESSGNTNIGSGQTPATARLQVKGSGSTSATTSLLVQNSNGIEKFKITDGLNGDIIMRSNVKTNGEGVVIQSLNGTDQTAQLTIKPLTGAGAVRIWGDANRAYFGMTNTNGVSSDNIYAFTIDNRKSKLAVTPDDTTTDASFYGKAIWDGGAAMTLRSFSVTQTARIFNVENFDSSLNYLNVGATGIVSLGTTSPNASAKLQVDSTTQGFLPPRMTNAQRLAIATPAVGLMVYCTDAVEGLYVYKSIGWTFVI